VGSRSKIDLAYIAGFLDGDGSLMLQIKKRKDGKSKKRFMSTICFYQDSRHEAPLHWIRDVFGIGYISRRNDGMTELRINGFEKIKSIMKLLLPYIRFKGDQARAMYEANKLLSLKTLKQLSKIELLHLIDHILTIQNENYSTKKKKTREELIQILDLTP